MSESETLNAFKNFDWENELKSFEEDAELGKDWPPGIGIHNGFGQNKNAVLLHICAKNKNSVFLIFFTDKKRSERTFFIYKLPRV